MSSSLIVDWVEWMEPLCVNLMFVDNMVNTLLSPGECHTRIWR